MDTSSGDPYALLLRAIRLVPLAHYLVAGLCALLLFLYTFLEIHFFQDLLAGLRGSPAAFTHHPSSHIFNGVVSKCRILRSRYLATPWLSSPHVQTVFLNFFGRAPRFSYRRELFRASDGGTIALDWLTSFDVQDGGFHTSNEISRDDTTPIMLVIPGLTSDSHSPYLKHLAFGTAKNGWHVCVSNHRGLGGVSITSDRFYNAGWTGDLRAIANYLHREYPKAPLFAVGTSIGANVMVKYLGEEGDNVPFAGAVAICSPWDLLIGDRFIRRRSAQKFYDRALTIGLQGYAQLHEPRYSRLANWEGILKSRTIRDFDDHATRLVGQFETVDTYYRHASSASYVRNVSVPLLCVSALDDPVCTREAIPWDECRENKNVVLATVKHGGHLAFFEGITASSLWWVRATCDFLEVLRSSKYMHVQSKIPNPVSQSPLDSTIDQAPFLSLTEDGTVATVCDEQTENYALQEAVDPQEPITEETEKGTSIPNPDNTSVPLTSDSVHTTTEQSSVDDVVSPVRRCLDLLRRQNGYTIWLLAYIAVVTSWPLLGSAIRALYRKRLRNLLPAALLRR